MCSVDSDSVYSTLLLLQFVRERDKGRFKWIELRHYSCVAHYFIIIISSPWRTRTHKMPYQLNRDLQSRGAESSFSMSSGDYKRLVHSFCSLLLLLSPVFTYFVVVSLCFLLSLSGWVAGVASIYSSPSSRTLESELQCDTGSCTFLICFTFSIFIGQFPWSHSHCVDDWNNRPSLPDPNTFQQARGRDWESRGSSQLDGSSWALVGWFF